MQAFLLGSAFPHCQKPYGDNKSMQSDWKTTGLKCLDLILGQQVEIFATLLEKASHCMPIQSLLHGGHPCKAVHVCLGGMTASPAVKYFCGSPMHRTYFAITFCSVFTYEHLKSI